MFLKLGRFALMCRYNHLSKRVIDGRAHFAEGGTK